MDVFADTSEGHLRAILVALCQEDAVRFRAVKLSKKLTAAGGDSVICVQCLEAYLPSADNKQSCRYHPGEMEVDYDNDTWADHEENVHGTIDSKEKREECPQGFIWDCCEEPGDEPGCVVGPHRQEEELMGSDDDLDPDESEMIEYDEEDEEDEDEEGGEDEERDKP